MDAKLIPRDVLFGNPERAMARLSPDGKYLSFMAPVDGVLNVWVGPAGDMKQAKPVTKEKVRPIPGYSWAYDSKHILYSQDTNGNENFHLFATDVDTAETKDLTPIDGVRAELQEISQKFPHEILVGLNDRNKQLHDIWRVNIDTGEKTLVEENPGVAGLPHGRRLQRPDRAQLHARPAARFGCCPRAKATRRRGRSSRKSGPKTP